MWPNILDRVEIGFAYKSFKWQNNAVDNAGVTVVIISLQNKSNSTKRLFDGSISFNVNNINHHLEDKNEAIVLKSNKNLSGLPEMRKGSTATEGENLILEPDEYSTLTTDYPEAKKYIKKYAGSKEYINNLDRYCLWIEDNESDEALAIKGIKERTDKVIEFRSTNSDKNVCAMAAKPWAFFRKSFQEKNAILVPVVSSERREYIPMGYVTSATIISYAAFAVYDAEPWLFAILESKIHMAWIRTVCGKLKTDYRYSSTLGYNTFPCPPLTPQQKEKLNNSARNVLFARANHPDLTLAEMYDPDKMPEDLRKAHEENDILVDKLYRPTPFQTDEARLAVLFKLYEEMTARE